MERIAEGFSLAEAPVVTAEDVLLVSDALGGGVRRFDAGGVELDALLERRRGIGGMAQLPDGRIVVSGRDLSVVDGTGMSAVLAELEEAGTGYNDITVAPDGTVLAGMLTFRPFTDAPLTPGAVVSVAPDGTTVAAALSFCWPIGAGFSPSGDVFYLADFATGVVHRSPWTGSVDELQLAPWITSPTGDADGLAVGETGDVWVAGGAGGDLLRYTPAGALVERLTVGDDFVSSCCFWPGRDRLVITTGTGVFWHDL